jgi:hypothetical protein
MSSADRVTLLLDKLSGLAHADQALEGPRVIHFVILALIGRGR